MATSELRAVTPYAPYQRRREAWWPEVERCLGELPSRLLRRVVLLRHDVATYHSATGQFEDILRSEAELPLLYLHVWLLDDWQCARSAARTRLERHVFLASIFVFLAARTREAIVDPDTAFDEGDRDLADALHAEARRHLRLVFPAASRFWAHERTLSRLVARAVRDYEARKRRPRPFRERDLLSAGATFAFTRLPVIAAAMHARRAAALPALLGMLDHLDVLFRLRADIVALRRDLQRGHATYPIVHTMSRAGLSLGEPVVPERVLAALVLTDALSELCRDGLGRLERCRATARALRLDRFLACFDDLEDSLRGLGALFTFRAEPTAAPVTPPASRPVAGGHHVSFLAAADTLAQATAMAEGYLRSEQAMRESREVQRTGVLGDDEVVAPAFGPGLIVEVLCRHHPDAAEQIGVIFDAAAGTGFRYYEHPRIPPDADDLGLLLRLHRHSGDQAAHRRLLATPLRWLQANVLPSGRIPCWFTKGVDGLADAEPVVLWGNACATVEANVLLGLITYDDPDLAPLVERAARAWLDRWLAGGLGATSIYVDHYALWAASELLAALGSRPAWSSLEPKIARARRSLSARVAREIGAADLSPQTAALLALAGRKAHPPWPSPLVARCITVLLKTQRCDGSWPAEPLFVTPGRGGQPTWYASAAVTTAFCYDALRSTAAGRTRSGAAP